MNLIVGLLLSGLLTAHAQNQVKDSSAQPAAKQTEAAPSPKIDPAKEADIRRLPEVTGVKAAVAQTMTGMAENIKPVLRQSFPPGEYREKLIDLFFERFKTKVNLDEILDLSVPIYDKYFTQEEIRNMIKFYETPLG